MYNGRNANTKYVCIRNGWSRIVGFLLSCCRNLSVLHAEESRNNVLVPAMVSCTTNGCSGWSTLIKTETSRPLGTVLRFKGLYCYFNLQCTQTIECVGVSSCDFHNYEHNDAGKKEFSSFKAFWPSQKKVPGSLEVGPLWFFLFTVHIFCYNEWRQLAYSFFPFQTECFFFFFSE